MKTTAVCVGDNCIDHYLLPINRRFVGGNAVNVAVQLRRAGIPTAYIGAVGVDSDGSWILDSLKCQGINVSLVDRLPGPTARTDIRIDSRGDRQFVHEQLGPKDLFHLNQTKLDFIRSHRLVHNTSLGGTEDYLYQFKQNKDLIVSMDYGERCTADFIGQTITHVDLAFFSLPEEQWHEAQELAWAIVKRGPRCAIVTSGSKGSLAYDGAFYTQAAFETDVVDTLGAGDTYIGRFLAYWLKGSGIRECMQVAAKAAALTCTHYGAWIPDDPSGLNIQEE